MAEDTPPSEPTPPGPPILGVNIEDEVRRSFLDYSMSVIVSRALPDVRDGLKPVHRRILYAMQDEGLLSNRPFSKSAGVVGEVIKHYHPHGDQSIYDAMVRRGQGFSRRYPLTQGQGHFGASDGDPETRRWADLVACQEGAVVSATVMEKKVGTVTAFAFAAGQGLSEHTARYDALVYIIDGVAGVTISGTARRLGAGEVVVMPANEPHALRARENFKMLFVMIRE